MMQAIATTKMPMKFSAAVRLQQERMYRQAFHYFDRDRDGFIGEKDLLQLLHTFGKAVTADDMEKIMISFKPGAITERDFLNLMASKLVLPNQSVKAKLRDSCKLFTAAHTGAPSDTLSSGFGLKVSDGNSMSREHWHEFQRRMVTPITGRDLRERAKMKEYLAYLPPDVAVARVPATNAGGRQTVNYVRWLNAVQVKVPPKSPSEQMLKAFKLFNHEKRNRRCKFIDGEFAVDDQGTIRTDDLYKIISANSGATAFRSGYGQPSKDECDEFMRFAKGPRFAAGPNHVNYVRLVQALS